MNCSAVVLPLVLQASVLRLARQQVVERGVQIVDPAFLDQFVYQRQCTADAQCAFARLLGEIR
jgi:hypothetical protein